MNPFVPRLAAPVWLSTLSVLALGCVDSAVPEPQGLDLAMATGSIPASAGREMEIAPVAHTTPAPQAANAAAVEPATLLRETFPMADSRDEKFSLTDEEWRKRLTPEEYAVLRQQGTERPFVNEYDHHFEPGTYVCKGCGQELFRSATKFNSGCGWPAFYAAAAGDRVTLRADASHGMVRTEVICARCDSHLGHVFNDAPQTPTGERFCINSVSIKFVPDPKAEQATKLTSE